jgi:hypothetical protein
MDGFQIGKKFFCKELGAINLGDSEASSFFFDIGLHWNELNEKTRERVTSSRRIYINSHLACRGALKHFKFRTCQAIVENFYREIQIDSNSTIAFKGGHYERDLLASLRIPAVNLECFNCPKAEKIFDQLISVRNLWEPFRKQRLSTLRKSRTRSLCDVDAAVKTNTKHRFF